MANATAAAAIAAEGGMTGLPAREELERLRAGGGSNVLQ
jgi:hypothetical protein